MDAVPNGIFANGYDQTRNPRCSGDDTAGGKNLSTPTAPTHMPEYSQKASAIDPTVYGALAGAVRFELTARGFGVDVGKA